MKKCKTSGNVVLLLLLVAFSFTSTVNGQVTATTLQSDVTCALVGDQNVPVIVVKINVPTGSGGSVASLTFSTAGSTFPSDIWQAKLFYTANISTFSTSDQIGASVVNPNGVFTITFATVSLINGDYYFWLAYDISMTAPFGDFVDAECSAAGTYIPSVTAPAGNILIGCSSGIDSPAGEENAYIFPVPFSNTLNFVNENNEKSEIILFDIASRFILQKAFTGSVTINTGQLAKGLYFYEVRNKYGITKKGKAVKE
ncbi:MAG: T9SS type A sorting domain-containing protein [Bacteroidia bacterium]|nr:T9SS type A sorting domain-containing protein [Bacteroidia bacterium]